MALASGASSGGLIVLFSTGFLALVFLGIGAAIILSLIPSYLSARDITPSGEKYCISNLRLTVTFNSITPYGNFGSNSTNDSYSLSLACYRILQNYESDHLLSSCLISNCSFTTNIPIANTVITPNISCTAIIYYSSRCPDEGANSGINQTLNSTTNSACRTNRLANIDAALGSRLVQYTNVPSLTVSNTVIPITSIFSIIFGTYSQVGAYYCGIINRTAIANAVNTQANG